MKKLFAKLKKLIKDIKDKLRGRSIVKKIYIAFVAVALFFIFYHIGYSKSIVPGVKVGSMFLGGMNFDEALKTLQKGEGEMDKTVVLTYKGKKYTISENGVGLEYNLEATATRAFEIGRTGNFYRDTKDKLASLIKTVKLKAYYLVDDDALSAKFAQIRGEINQEAKDAAFVLSDGALTTVSAVGGRKVSDQKMYEKTMESIEYMDFSAKSLFVEDKVPVITEDHLSKVKLQVEEIVFNPITITYKDSKWELSPDQMLDFIDVNLDNGEPVIGLDNVKFDSYVKNLAQDINQLPRGEITKTEGDKVIEFKAIQNGISLDTDTFTEDFKKSFFGNGDEVAIKVNEVESLEDPSDYGIFTLLGRGESKFTGSGAARVHNLGLAAERTNGVLVPPGEIYSLNNSIGEISKETGYDTGYIISNGRTVLGEGGGVCQTSTTMFRAVLNSGLPVMTRHPHAYRVIYYEIDKPVGFDAAVYQPSIDFEFKNDTPNHILIQTEFSPSQYTLAFEIYGTPDGREVEISEPVVSNLVKPPEPLYKETDELPPGETKQIDFAAWGSHVYFTREVTKNDELMFKDTFSSSYQPWRAIFLVGKED